MHFKNKTSLRSLKYGQKARVIKPEALKVRVQFDAAYACGLHAVKLGLPLGVAGVYCAEGNNTVRVRPLQADGVIIGRNNLCRGCGRAQDHAHVDTGPALTFQQIGYGAVARTDNIVVSVQVFHRLVCNLWVKGVGVDVDAHG